MTVADQHAVAISGLCSGLRMRINGGATVTPAKHRHRDYGPCGVLLLLVGENVRSGDMGLAITAAAMPPTFGSLET